jgi:predicted acylesterase/phospholipase RssA
MKLLSLSGGGTKISAMAGAAITLLTNYDYQPDIIVGSSAGGLLTLPLAMGKFEELKKTIFNLTLRDMFNVKPVKSNGKIRFLAALRLLFGYESLGKQDNLIKTIGKIITKEVFEEYKQNSNYPNVYVVAVGFKTGSRKYFNVRDLQYNEYLNAIKATSSIPFFVESVKIDGEYYYDGCLRDHMPSHWILENFDIEENISIYSRPVDFNMTEEDWTPKNALEVLERTTAIMLAEISKNDQLQEEKISQEEAIKNTQIFIPHIITESAYDLDPEKMESWFNIGIESTNKYMK